MQKPCAEKLDWLTKKQKSALQELEADIQQIKDAREASKVLLVEKQKAISIAESEYNKPNELEKIRVLNDELNEEFTELKNHFSSLQKEVSDAQTKKTNLDNDTKKRVKNLFNKFKA